MALMGCRRCGTQFAMGAPWCPQCTSTDAYEVGSQEDPDVAKISRQGVTDQTAEPGTTVTTATGDEVEVAAATVDAAATDTGADTPLADEPEAGATPEGPTRPAADARKADWQDYVRVLGGDPGALTLAQLQDLADDLERAQGLHEPNE